MSFWTFMLLFDLLIPVTMIVFGKIFMKNPPKRINSVYGYRTAMSRKNKETWQFAHTYCGRLWVSLGLVLLVLSAAACLFLLGKDVDTIGYGGGIICFVQMAVMISSIFFVEKALNRAFDKSGRRKV